MRRREFVGTLGCAGAALPAWAQQAVAPDPLVVNPEGLRTIILTAPNDPALWPAYREALARWRQRAREQVKYDDSLYRRPDFAWVPASFCCCFVMICDEMFYDRKQDRYTWESWIDRGRREFGGYDSIVLWHAYPRIGVDQRNQFDIYRDTPGGVEKLRDLSRGLHSRGVKVYVDYNPWDTGTRREPVSDIDAVVRTVRETEADGIFLDTMNKGASELRAKLDAVRPGVVLEGEVLAPIQNVHDHHMSWAQGGKDSQAPGVLRNKWFERRHMQHQIWRWNHDHTEELQVAWMNGSGMMVWENVFGSWVGWNARDRSILRSMLPVQRRYSALFSSEGWTPLVNAEAEGAYASLWESGRTRLWTVVNRSGKTAEGALLRVSHQADARYFDLIAGRALRPGVRDGRAVLTGSIRPAGIGCFLSSPETALGADFRRFLSDQAGLDARADWTAEFHPLNAVLKPPERIAARRPEAPAGMAAVGPVELEMTIDYRTRECGYYQPQGYVQGLYRGYALHKPANVISKAALGRYAIDLAPVTNAEFAEFLKRSGYRPRHSANFLKHWINGSAPGGLSGHPVVYVDLDDARAYAAWAGKRLPTEEEWQYAAQGGDGRKYPWGNEWAAGRCNTGEQGGTTPVRAYPDGRSPFGCYDMCGNTWEWTESERSDGRTRFCIIRGGSYFRARGSEWYMDGGPQPCSFGAKFLTMWPGLDRCATIGFRCALDLA